MQQLLTSDKFARYEFITCQHVSWTRTLRSIQQVPLLKWHMILLLRWICSHTTLISTSAPISSHSRRGSLLDLFQKLLLSWQLGVLRFSHLRLRIIIIISFFLLRFPHLIILVYFVYLWQHVSLLFNFCLVHIFLFFNSRCGGCRCSCSFVKHILRWLAFLCLSRQRPHSLRSFLLLNTQLFLRRIWTFWRQVLHFLKLVSKIDWLEAIKV